MSEQNGNAIWLTRWILGGFGALLTVLLSYLITTVTHIAADMTQLKVQQGILENTSRQTAQLGEIVRAEQQSRTSKLADIDLQLTKLDAGLQMLSYQLKQTDQRYTTISERILSINKRLDRTGVQETPGEIE